MFWPPLVTSGGHKACQGKDILQKHISGVVCLCVLGGRRGWDSLLVFKPCHTEEAFNCSTHAQGAALT